MCIYTFNKNRLSDPKLLELIDRTRVVYDAEINRGYPRGIPNDVTITCTDGSTFNKRVDFPRGHAENPMTDDEVIAKFRGLTHGLMTDKSAERILEMAWDLDKLNDVTPLFSFEMLEQ